MPQLRQTLTSDRAGAERDDRMTLGDLRAFAAAADRLNLPDALRLADHAGDAFTVISVTYDLEPLDHPREAVTRRLFPQVRMLGEIR